jgi:hypothetical protein
MIPNLHLFGRNARVGRSWKVLGGVTAFEDERATVFRNIEVFYVTRILQDPRRINSSGVVISYIQK